MDRQKLKRRRQELGLTLQEVADKVGLTRATIQKYESGYIKGIDTEMLNKLSQVLKTTPADLLGYKIEGPVTCDICGFSYVNYIAEDVELHNNYHNSFLAAEEKFPELLKPNKAQKVKEESSKILHSTEVGSSAHYNACYGMIQCYFSRSLRGCQYDLNHVSFDDYAAMLLNQDCFKKRFSRSYQQLKKRYGQKPGIPEGKTYYKPHISFEKDSLDLLEEKEEISYNNEEYTPVPLIGEVAAGIGAYAENNIIDYIETPNSWLKGNEDYVYLKVSGDSMEPEMHTGDLALIRVQTSIDSGDYAVVIIDGENGVIKRVIYDSNWVELQSVNTMYAPRRFENENLERVRVFGLVRKILRNYDGSLPLSNSKSKSTYKLNSKSVKDNGIELYKQLDSEDKSKIKVKMKKMLTSEKYNKPNTTDDPSEIIDNYIENWNSKGQIAAQGQGMRTVKIPDNITDEELLKMIEDSQKFKTK